MTKENIKHGQAIGHDKKGTLCCEGCYMIGLKDGVEEGKSQQKRVMNTSPNVVRVRTPKEIIEMIDNSDDFGMETVKTFKRNLLEQLMANTPKHRENTHDTESK